MRGERDMHRKKYSQLFDRPVFTGTAKVPKISGGLLVTDESGEVKYENKPCEETNQILSGATPKV